MTTKLISSIMIYAMFFAKSSWSFNPSINKKGYIHQIGPKRTLKTLNKQPFHRRQQNRLRMSSASSSDNRGTPIDPNSLSDMDIVIFSKKTDPKTLQLGAIQEDGTLAPLSAWTREPAFGESIEFLVDEDDRWLEDLELDKVDILSILGEDVISYGSRQVGGGKGPGNPHGEESELLYYIENKVIEDNSIDIVLKPELEILW